MIFSVSFYTFFISSNLKVDFNQSNSIYILALLKCARLIVVSGEKAEIKNSALYSAGAGFAL